MSYVVLARKWRPQHFDDLTGQQHVATTLKNALRQDRVPHALLFTGARGVGKTSSARILAMALNCAEGPTETPCGKCASCQEVQRAQSVDVLEIDGASNRGINEIRELRDSVRYAPNRDRYKVYIIDEVHMLTTEAFNALLKTLEEPPKHVVFVFATTEAHKIPVTILSRCQRFDFRRIPYPEIVERLVQIAEAESLEIDRDVLGVIARQAAGGMRDALSLLDQVIAFAGTRISLEEAGEILGAAERRRLFELSDAIIGRDLERALSTLDTVLSFGVDVAHLAQELVGHFRDLTLVSVTRDVARVTTLTESEIEQARAQVAKTETRTLHRLFERLVGACEVIQRSAHARMRLEMTLVQLVALEPQAPLEALIARLEQLSGGASLPPAPSAPPSSTPAPSSGSAPTESGAQGRAAETSALPAAAPPPPRAMPEQVEAREATNADAEASNNDEAAHGTPSPDAPAPETPREEAQAGASPSEASAPPAETPAEGVSSEASSTAERAAAPEAREPDALAAAEGDASAEPEEAQPRADDDGAAADRAEPDDAPADGRRPSSSISARARRAIREDHRHPARSSQARSASRTSAAACSSGSLRSCAGASPPRRSRRCTRSRPSMARTAYASSLPTPRSSQLRSVSARITCSRSRRPSTKSRCAASKHGLGSTQR